MKNALLAALTLCTSVPAFATSLHPCTPTVKAMDTHISCRQGAYRYAITVQTLMSPPIEMCQGSQYYERKSAKVVEQDADGNIFQEFSLFDGEFEYTGSPTGDATFKSDKLGLDLTECVTPIHGGVSFGN